MSDFTPTATGTGAKARVQRFGAFLAGMVMPNLGAFIAFGLITALFIPTGWVNIIAGRPADDRCRLPRRSRRWSGRSSASSFRC